MNNILYNFLLLLSCKPCLNKNSAPPMKFNEKSRKKNKMKSIENNEIVWNNQEPPKSVQNVPQVQKIKEPSTAEKNPGRPIDPNISRKVKLKNLE